MKKVNIIIPSNDYVSTEKYYREALNFNYDTEEGTFKIPENELAVRLRILTVDEESKISSPARLYFHLFNYSIEKIF